MKGPEAERGIARVCARFLLSVLVAGFWLSATEVVWAAEVAATAEVAPDSSEQAESCGAVVSRPDRRFSDYDACIPEQTPEQIAARAQVVLFGSFLDVSEKLTGVPRARRCAGPYTHMNNARYVEKLRRARAVLARPPLLILHLHRFELVPVPFAALPGFDPRVATTRSC